MALSYVRWAAAVLLTAVPIVPAEAQTPQARSVPRTAEGRPDLQGIWQVNNRAAVDLEDHTARLGMPAGRSVVLGGPIPYQPWAAQKKRENFATRAKTDPLG